MSALDRLAFGLIAALLVLIGIYIYLQMRSVRKYFPIEAFYEGSFVEIPEEEVMLKPENIMLPADFKPEDVKNITRDASDTRERSMTEYYDNRSAEDVVQSLHDLEQQMLAEAGGEAERAKIREQMAERKQKAIDEAKRNANQPDPGKGTTGDKVYAGNVMVDFSVPTHTAYQNNKWYVRNPGYTCPRGSSGTVVMLVKVSQGGTVTSATYDPSRSSGANSCMIEQAKKYALMSKFNYSSSAPKSQEGWISYTFVSG